jgi:predicted nucleotidyltransferase
MTDLAPNLARAVSSKAVEHLRAFKNEIEQVLPGKIERVLLFGSRARGDAQRNSDYDVAVFVRHLDNQRSTNHLLADAAYPHILRGIFIRPVALPADFLTRGQRNSLSISIEREGITIT